MAGTIPSSTAWRARLLEDRDIVGGDLQGTRSSATHGAAPMAGKRDQSQLTSRPEFLALLSSGPTRGTADRRTPAHQETTEKTLGTGTRTKVGNVCQAEETFQEYHYPLM